MIIRIIIYAILSVLIGTNAIKAADRPNILWITCEDISPYLGCYGFEQAQTPNLDQLAAEGVRFTRAYANAPVCGVARSALLTGMHSATIGTHQMRAREMLPDSIPNYPSLFGDVGYYCTNNGKTDYNSSYEFIKNELWDESSRDAHWKNRPPGKPFFAVFNFTVTHESQLKESNQKKYIEAKQIPETPRIPPEEIQLPPYHPDLPDIRHDWARLHDLITLMDGMAGQKLQELDEAGLKDDTIVFFYSDHGGSLSRAKRYIYNVGTQVPLIVRVPKKWKHLSAGDPGGTYDAIAQFVDLPKTVLSLAGIKPPALMQGRVLFGPGKEAPATHAYFYRDRMAERYDFSRAVTDGRYYLIRNFTPHRPRGRDALYGYDVQANWRAWRDWYEKDPEGAGPIRSQFYQNKPVVQLFDTDADLWQVENLAGTTIFQTRLEQLEAELDQLMVENRDCGLIPECLFGDLVGEGKTYQTLYEFAQSAAYPVQYILEAAKSASSGKAELLSDYLEMLNDEDPIVRHWGAYGLFLIRDSSPRVQVALRKMSARDRSAGNRVMAARALALSGDSESAFKAIRKEARETTDGYVFLFAINAFQYSHTDDRLEKVDWAFFKTRTVGREPSSPDRFGWENAKRIISDALELWPERREVY